MQTQGPGGHGIENLEVKNKCLLSKWVYRLSAETGGMWAQILCNKYLHFKSLAQVTIRSNDSPFWKGLMRVKDTFFHRAEFAVGSGTTTRF